MPVCEICGAEIEKTSRARIEGTVLDVCKKCAMLGEVMPEAAIPVAKAAPRVIDFSEIVVPGFGKLIKNAREGQKLEFKALAEKLKIKEPIMHRVEQERLVPDLELAKRIERVLNIRLVERIEDE